MSDLVHGVSVVEVADGLRPIRPARTSVIGIIGTAPDADSDVFPADQPFVVTSLKQARDLILSNDPEGDGGTLLPAVQAIYAQAGAICVIGRTKPIGTGEGTQTAESFGESAAALFRAAAPITGLKPRILIAPGQGMTGASIANQIFGPIATTAKALRAIVVIDGPNDDADAAIDFAGDISGNRDRIYMVDPMALVGDEPRASSAYAAGVIARTDNDRGFWWSPSNKEISGISGTARPIDFALGDANCEADILNGAHIATIIRHSGFRLWGNRTLETEDPRYQFLSVRRTADVLMDSIQDNHMWAVDRPITRNYLRDVVAGVEAYMRQLVALGAINGGRCWLDPELNTPEALSLGQVYLNFDFGPTPPAERITFRAHLNNDYLEEILPT